MVGFLVVVQHARKFLYLENVKSILSRAKNMAEIMIVLPEVSNSHRGGHPPSPGGATSFGEKV